MSEDHKAQATSGSEPDFVTALVAIYGGPSDEGFGSAVFFRPLDEGAPLEPPARETYRLFVGELWDRWGEDAWLGPWEAVYERVEGKTSGIAAELRALDDVQDRSMASLLLDNPQDAEAAARALAAAFDDDAVRELKIYRIGDGEAMSGLLIAGRRSGSATFLVELLD